MASLNELLEKNSTRLCKKLDEARKGAIRCTGPDVEDFGAPRFDQWKWQAFARQMAENSRQPLNEFIFDELDRPAPCVIEDAFDQLAHNLMVADREHASAFKRFCTALLADVCAGNVSSPFPFQRGCFFAHAGGGGASFQVQGWPILWVSPSPNGSNVVNVNLAAALPLKHASPHGTDILDSSHEELELYAYVGVRGSRRAFEQIEAEIKRILPSVFKTFMMVVKEESREDLEPEEEEEDYDLPVTRLTDDSGDLREELILVVWDCLVPFPVIGFRAGRRVP